MLCYNFGVELYQKKKLEEAVSWLKESFEMGKHQTNLDARNQVCFLELKEHFDQVDWWSRKLECKISALKFR